MITRCKLLLPLVTLALAALAGCRTTTTIADINRDPGRFTGKEITISGKVSDAFGGLGNGVFSVDDGTGKIWVFSQNFGLPQVDANSFQVIYATAAGTPTTTPPAYDSGWEMEISLEPTRWPPGQRSCW